MKDHVQIPKSNQHLNFLFGIFSFSKLTKIQKKVSPIILQKKDCFVITPTDFSKTEYSVILIFSHIKNAKKTRKIKSLYITPLRALNRDVFRRIIKYVHEN